MSVSPIVIKVGGALLDDTAAMTRLFLSVKDVQATRPVVVVHGGGPLVETLMASLGLQSTKIDGLRVTPDEHMPYICGALAGSLPELRCARTRTEEWPDHMHILRTESHRARADMGCAIEIRWGRRKHTQGIPRGRRERRRDRRRGGMTAMGSQRQVTFKFGIRVYVGGLPPLTGSESRRQWHTTTSLGAAEV